MNTCLPLLEEEKLPARRLETLLLYALHADSNLDIEQLARSIESSKHLKKATMSVAEKLKAEGRAEGEARGVWRGRIQVLESLMEKEATPDQVLSGLGMAELEAKFEALQKEYNENVKGK
jgi:hypothetical protein